MPNSKHQGDNNLKVLSSFCIANCNYCTSIHRADLQTDTEKRTPCHLWSFPETDFSAKEKLYFNTRLFPFFSERLEEIERQELYWIIDGQNFSIDSDAIYWGLSHHLIDQLVICPRPGIDFFETLTFLQKFDYLPPIEVHLLMEPASAMSWVSRCQAWFPHIIRKMHFKHSHDISDSKELSNFYQHPNQENLQSYIYSQNKLLKKISSNYLLRTFMHILSIPIFLFFSALNLLVEITHNHQRISSNIDYLKHRVSNLPHVIIIVLRRTYSKFYWGGFHLKSQVILGFHKLYWLIHKLYWTILRPKTYVIRKPFYYLEYRIKKLKTPKR